MLFRLLVASKTSMKSGGSLILILFMGAQRPKGQLFDLGDADFQYQYLILKSALLLLSHYAKI